MIKKEVITMQSESWFDESRTHRYVLRKQWHSGLKEDKDGPIALVITIRPTTTSAFVEDLTSLLVERNIRQLGFTGFIAVNLFSSINAKNKATFLNGNDEHSSDVISTVLKEKRISQIIFACGSILTNNVTASNQAAEIYEQLSAKQKKITRILVDPNSGKVAHPLNAWSRKEWVLDKLNLKLFDTAKSTNDKTTANGSESSSEKRTGNV